jgi:hypothetical protein
MARIECPPDCPDAPFPHVEVITPGRIDPKTHEPIQGQKFILCADCSHYWNRPRGNCRCPESCHISDLFETDS